jgi:aerobic carbon-monoxide dehydrogenase large subunit
MPRLDLENPRTLVTGRGRYIADLAFEGCLEVCFVRSTLPHAAIASLELGTKHGVIGRDLGLATLDLEARGLVTIPWHPLAVDRVRYVGEPIAVTWGADRYEAEDRADAVSVEYEPLAEGTPVHESAPDGVLFSARFDSGGVEEAMARAHLVLERTFRAARQSALPLECRGVVADHDVGTGVTTVWSSTQIPHLVRKGISDALRCEEASIRVLVPHVGGGFGLKAQLFPEEIALAALARRLGQPVRWIEDRRENLVASNHAHDTAVAMRVAVAADGRVIAIDADVETDVGAYSVWPFSASLEPATAAVTLFGPYAFGAIRYRARGIASNRCPVGAHRGVGMNAGVFASERMMDTIAAELAVDPLELRQRNAIRKLPTTTAAGRRLDSGDYLGLLERLEKESGYQELRRQQAEARREGRLVGIGIGFFNEHSGGGSADYLRRGVRTIPGRDAARVVVTGDGRIEIYTSAAEAGQGHAETYRALAAAQLGLRQEQVDVIEGDTDLCPDGTGTFASRGAVGVAESVVQALRKAAEQDLAPGTDVSHVHDPIQVYPCGAHLAVVEVDAMGMVPRATRYVAVEDCGVIIHAALVDEQVLGGVATGVGDVLLEEHRYSTDGQILTASLLDYLLPLASDVPPVEIHHLTSPGPTTTVGSKGVGEAGTIGAFAAVANAVADAVRPLGAELTDLPFSPDRIFAAVPRAGSAEPHSQGQQPPYGR